LVASNTGGSGTGTVANLITFMIRSRGGNFSTSAAQQQSNTAPDGDYTGAGMKHTNKISGRLESHQPGGVSAHHQASPIRTARNNQRDLSGANGDSTCRRALRRARNVLEFTAGTASGDYSTNFASANVTNILSGGTGTGIVANMVDAGGATNTPSRYYRVRVWCPEHYFGGVPPRGLNGNQTGTSKRVYDSVNNLRRAPSSSTQVFPNCFRKCRSAINQDGGAARAII